MQAHLQTHTQQLEEALLCRPEGLPEVLSFDAADGQGLHHLAANGPPHLYCAIVELNLGICQVAGQLCELCIPAARRLCLLADGARDASVLLA